MQPKRMVYLQKILGILLLILFFPLSSFAASVESHSCRNVGEKISCEIRLSGSIEVGDRLLINGAGFNDQLFFKLEAANEDLYLFRYWDHQILAPRIFHLSKWQGSKDISLHWISYDPFFKERGERSRDIKFSVISESYPMRRIIRGPILATGFAFLAFLFLAFGLSQLSSHSFCGWIYPREEFRWWYISNLLYVFFDSNFISSLSPNLWSIQAHIFLQKIFLTVMAWSLVRMILLARLDDGSTVERNLKVKVPEFVFILLDASFCLSLFLGASKVISLNSWYIANFPLLPFIALSCAHGVKSVDWKKITIRFGVYTPLFHGSLLFLVSGLILLYARQALFNSVGLSLFQTIPLAVASFGAIHLNKNRKYQLELLNEIRALLRDQPDPLRRLDTLMDFVASEWGVARTSIIVVEGNQGLMLSSAGPDSITLNEGNRIRNLGPFLRRVIKVQRPLYAPQAEELGKDLQSHGLKHSSLAIPFLENNSVYAVVCVMAEEGERISPDHAQIIEGCIKELKFEIFSAIRQKIAEDRSARLWEIAKHSDSVMLEQLDRWGNLPDHPHSTERIIAGIKLDLLSLSPLPKMECVSSALKKELYSLWSKLAEEFEFLVKEQDNTFLFISPKGFRDNFLNSCDSFFLASSFLQIVERHTKLILQRDSYSILGAGNICTALGKVTLHWKLNPSEKLYFPVIDPKSQSDLEKVLSQSKFGGLLSLQDPGPESKTCGLLTREVFSLHGQTIYAVLPLSAERKEFKRLELSAVMKWKANQATQPRVKVPKAG